MESKNSDQTSNASSTQKSQENNLSEFPSVLQSLLPKTTEEQSALDNILELLVKCTQIDFIHYRKPTLLRRISRRFSHTFTSNYGEYCSFLENNPSEIDKLCEDLLLSHTQFFRNQGVFETLKENVFPNILKNLQPKTPIRIWVAGCSTGEEVYSLAICLHEYLSEIKAHVAVQIFGTDINNRRIVKARRAVYTNKILDTVSPQRIALYFDEIKEGFRVTKQIREMCVFAVQDVTQDPPFPSIDLISCRNVLIYFDASLQEMVIPLFHFALNSHGYLLLGSSESMGKFTDYFSAENEKINLYAKRFSQSKPLYRFPIISHSTNTKPGIPKITVSLTPSALSPHSDIQTEIDNLLLNNYAPPCLVVDASMHIRHFRGDTSPYLTPSAGEASLKLSKMTSEGLMPDLYIAIEESKKKKCKVIRNNITFKHQNTTTMVTICVTPFTHPTLSETFFLIAFEKQIIQISQEPTFSQHPPSENHEIALLKKELQTLKKHLQTIADEKDEVNQELWSANEEIQSTNEELQSVNEEMEAAKEELVSLNEEMRAKNLDLKEVEWKFRALFENGPIGVAYHEMIYDSNNIPVDYRFIDANTSYKELTGIDPRGKTVCEAFPGIENDPFNWIGTFGKIAREGGQIRFEQYLSVNNQWYDCVGYQYKQDCFVAAFLNITKRKLAEQAIIEHSNLLSLFIHNSPIYCYIKEVTSTQSTVLHASENFTNMIGISGSTMRGKTMHELYPQEFAEKMTADDWKVISEGVVLNLTETFNNRDYETIKFPILLNNKTLLAGYTIDVTDRNKMDKELQKTQRLESLGILAGGIAHDFNNLMSGIFGFIDLAIEESDKKKSLDYLTKAVGSIERARALTQQLLTFAKGGAPIQKATPLIPFVQETVLFALSGSNVLPTFTIEDNLWLTAIDKNQIAQAIDNIVINAKQAMEHGGTLEICVSNILIKDEGISTLNNGNYVKITIKDNGIGIPQDILPRIFDPFFTTKTTGHGLGLATCFSIMKRHGGSIEVTSEKGKGSTFYLYLPASMQNLEIKQEISPLHKGSGTILVMDDEEVLRGTMSGMLSSLGYTVTCFDDGQEILDFFEKAISPTTPPKAIILDLTIPGGMGGIATAQELRKTHANIPLFVASGYADDPVMKNPTKFGFTASICKPFTKNDLSNMLSANIVQ